ncbi:uncharacterized protein LOC133314700 [Gastrolobium bilobum]|uniref:uncharacterized protein LOC133314700 n=1 Tax=Gastrolobium bilobum TaxID=150636 RepID=UPI002AB31747|nr:uncharacterized protein LOC133314700 [Gastrolobium bilobum]
MHMLLTLLLVIAILASVGSTVIDDEALPGCKNTCGNVSIPYPFGIGVSTVTSENCFLEEELQLRCDNKSTLYRGNDSNVQILNITLQGQMDMLFSVSKFCKLGSHTLPETRIKTLSDIKKTQGNEQMLSTPAFTISSEHNKFISVGCDTYGYLNSFRDGNKYSTGCLTRCNSNYIIGDDMLSDGNCTGIGCCQVDIPPRMNNISLQTFSFNNFSDSSEFDNCSSSFVVKNGYYKFSLSDLKDSPHEELPLVVDWAVGNGTCENSRREANNACKKNSDCEDSATGYGYRCKCKQGYEGNPYLPAGCQDIDECKTSNNTCLSENNCHNTDGSYKCFCPKGKYGDGTKDGGCHRRNIVTQVVIGTGAGFMVLIVGISSLYLIYEKRKLVKLKEKFFKQNGGIILQQRLSAGENTSQSTTVFSAEELKKATNNYDESLIIGRGGYGTVYKGILSDKRIVAIKKSKIVDQSQIEQFINEVIVLSQINHRNVVKLLGCCLETEVPSLVYEFVNNGTLFDYIHKEGKAGNVSWKTRLRIAAEAAGALSYLHSAASIPIIHRDVKTANILLDDTYTTKVSDFGASRLVPLDQTELATLVQGTLGYLDPEYMQTSQLTQKSDVYSFGVVLVELLTGEKPLCFDRSEEKRSLAMHFLSCLREDRLFEVLQFGILNVENKEEIKEVAILATKCLRLRGDERPSMKEVAMELEGIRLMEKHPWINTDMSLDETHYLLHEASSSIHEHGDIDEALPGCKNTCGNVSIPYPFGIGVSTVTDRNCSLEEELQLWCNKSTSTLYHGNVQILSITLQGQMDMSFFVSKVCKKGFDRNMTFGNKPGLRTPAFTISSEHNKFVSVGCDTYGYLNSFRDGENYSTGCLTRCNSKVDMQSDGNCTGIGCCQVDIPPGMKNITLQAFSYNNFNDSSEFNNCSSSFVVKKGYYNFSVSHLKDFPYKEVPLVVDWAVGNDTCENSRREHNNSCKKNSDCEDSATGYGYRCKCKRGYEGNPFLPDGCRDIEECKNGSHDCISDQNCRETEGSFECFCPDGQFGNGKREGGGCQKKRDDTLTKILIGAGAGLMALFMVTSWLYLIFQKRKLIKLKEKFFKQNGGIILQQRLSAGENTSQSTTLFTAEQLKKATNNYDESLIIGRGGYGTVYKGFLSDKSIVAIKKSKIVDQSQIEQFINEVIVLSQINHRNVVKLLGCCLETEVPSLVYEFVNNGTLFDYIHKEGKSGNVSWKTRLRIAAEAAGALSYLHSAASIPIIHRDVKTANILLDDTYTTKVSDFGASRLVPLDQTELATLVQGTLGYLDPEYMQTSQLTQKSDVYSFGVVLAELLTGEKPLGFDRPEEKRSLAMHFLSCLTEDCMFEILQVGVLNEGNKEEIKEVAILATKCLRLRGEERPSMKEVAMELEGIRLMEKQPWINTDVNLEETHYLHHEASSSIQEHGDSSSHQNTGYDSIKDRVHIDFDDAR